MDIFATFYAVGNAANALKMAAYMKNKFPSRNMLIFKNPVDPGNLNNPGSDRDFLFFN